MKTPSVTVVRLFGMRRSGNHAIMRWVGSQLPGTVFFSDDVRLFKHSLLKTEPLFPDQPDRYASTGREYHILGYEDLPVRSLEAETSLPWLLEKGGKPDAWRDVLLLRSPWNLFASRLKKTMDLQGHRYQQGLFSLTGPRERRRTVALWKSHAREFLGQTQDLKNAPVTIAYDRWCADQTYREELSSALGGRFDDQHRDSIWLAGGGSSFDKMAHDGNASDMDTSERWRSFASHPAFVSLFLDREIVQLGEQIFGESSAAKELAKLARHSIARRTWTWFRGTFHALFVLRWRLDRPLWWARAARRRLFGPSTSLRD